ncbi:hypothetical protein [Moorena producens]|uniref:hypothetical protein n=1 Tax=Moorena producens TaxID=1155739 RepID=UPI003C7459F3
MSRMMADGTSTLSDYSDRTVVLEGKNLCHQDIIVKMTVGLRLLGKLRVLGFFENHPSLKQPRLYKKRYLKQE